MYTGRSDAYDLRVTLIFKNHTQQQFAQVGYYKDDFLGLTLVFLNACAMPEIAVFARAAIERIIVSRKPLREAG